MSDTKTKKVLKKIVKILIILLIIGLLIVLAILYLNNRSQAEIISGLQDDLNNYQCTTVANEDESTAEPDYRKYYSQIAEMAFLYPSKLGRTKPESRPGEKGSKFSVKFSKTSSVSFSGVSPHYSQAAAATVHDTYGYEEKGDSYFYKIIDKGETKLLAFTPLKVISTTKGDIPLLDNNSFTDPQNSYLLPNNAIGAVLNLDNDVLKGAAFWSTNTETLSLEELEEIVRSIDNDEEEQ